MRLAVFTRLTVFASTVLFLVSCSSPEPKRVVKVFQSGDKATVHDLTYNIIDTMIQPKLGERNPENRFYLIQMAVSNGGNQPVNVPAMSLVDDTGKSYPELADGTGVPNWLGVVRKVDPVNTEKGMVAFDAPAQHYKLRLTDDTDDMDVFVDLPLSFAHESMNDINVPPPALPDAPAPAPAPKK